VPVQDCSKSISGNQLFKKNFPVAADPVVGGMIASHTHLQPGKPLHFFRTRRCRCTLASSCTTLAAVMTP